MSQPRDILDAPGPLPDEPSADDVIEELDDTDPHVTKAQEEHLGLDFRDAQWGDELDAVRLPRAELEKVTPFPVQPLYILALAAGGRQVI